MKIFLNYKDKLNIHLLSFLIVKIVEKTGCLPVNAMIFRILLYHWQLQTGLYFWSKKLKK